VLLPVLVGLALLALIAAIVLLGLCIAGIAVMLRWDSLFTSQFLARILTGVGLLGLGIGGGALLMLMIDHVVRVLAKFARLHYALLNKAEV
jgi:hypothetical protein